MPLGFLGRLKLQPKLLPSFETQCHHCSSAWVGWGCCRTSCSNHRHGTRMPSIVEWAMLMEPQQYVPRKLEWGRRNTSPASQCNLLPGDCSTCSKTTGSCGLVSGPQEKKNICCGYICLLPHCIMSVVQYARKNTTSLYWEMQLPARKQAGDASLALNRGRQRYRAARAFRIFWLLQYKMSASTGNHGHRPATQPFLCSSPYFPVTPEPWWVIATGVTVN